MWVAHLSGEPDTWLGFVAALPAQDEQGWYLHSHLTGVREAYRGQGIGLLLKTRQRQWALEHGYRRLARTFDPLRARNAHFNIERLGVRVLAYRDDYYGSLMSRLNRSLATDRLVVEWPNDPAIRAHPTFREGDPKVLIDIPADLDDLLRQDGGDVLRALHGVRAAFTRCLQEGFHVSGFLRHAPGPCYVLRKSAQPL